MNAQEISIKHSALGWVKKSIDDNLSEIKIDLKQYIEEQDAELLVSVRQRLGIVEGVLKMIEHYGAAMLTEEMLALADFISSGEQDKGDQALEVLLRAVLQLPDYLEHIQSGHHDIPIAILPLLNDIRAVRNQDLFSEKLLFLPDLSMHEEEAELEAIDERLNQASRQLAKKLRPVYQLALVNVIRDQNVEVSLKRLEKVCETLEERSVSEQIARIWWIVGALIESVSRQQLELGVSIKNLLGKVDALFRVILIIGERGLLKRQPIELIKNFLFYIAQPECDGPKAQAIKTAYRLEHFLPSESVRSEVLDNIAGPNQALLKTVAEAMKAEIETVKSSLEVYVNGDLSKVETLKDLPQEMHVISDTLAMIGLGAQRQLIVSQIEIVKQILAGDNVADEEQLLSMAAELLQVEQALDQMPKRQPASEPPKSEADVSRDYELDSVLSAVVTAALDDIQKTKNALLEFVKDPGRKDNIDLGVQLLKEARGALLLLEHQRAVNVIGGLITYLRSNDTEYFLKAEQLDAMSAVVVSLEYYLESLGEHRRDAESILDLAETQLQGLLAGIGSSETDSIKPAEPPVQVVEPVVDTSTAEADRKAHSPDPATAQNQTDAAARPVADSEPEIQAEPEAEIEPAAAPVPGGEVEAEIEHKAEPEPEVEAGPEIELELELEDEPELELELETESVPDIELMSMDEMDESFAEARADHEADDGSTVQPPADDDLIEDTLVVPQDESELIEDTQVVPQADSELIQDTQVVPAAEPELIQDTQVVRPVYGDAESADATVIVAPLAEQQKQSAEGDAKRSPAFKIDSIDEELEILKPGSDPEILEIYLEEAEEESANIARLQLDWMQHPEDENALKNIRRAFHTIKGSGRLVGALKIGEFAWDFEQLLNRVIDKTVPPSPAVIDAVGYAGRALPELVHELKTSEPPQADIGYLRGLARALAEFKTEELLVDHTQTLSAVESPYDHITNGGAPAEDDEEDEDYSFGETTQVISSDVETIPEESPAVAVTEVHREFNETQPVTSPATVAPTPTPPAPTRSQQNVDSVNPNFDDTMLTEPPPIPSGDQRKQRAEAEARAKAEAAASARAESSYQRASDYSKGSLATSDEANEEVTDREPPAEPQADRESAIHVESIGDDFIGEGMLFGGNSEPTPSFDNTAHEDAAQNGTAVAATNAESESLQAEVTETSAPQEAEPDAIEMTASPEAEPDEIEMAAPPEMEAEEIEMTAPPEAEPDEIEMTAPPESDADEIEFPQLEDPDVEEIELTSPHMSVGEASSVDAADDNSGIEAEEAEEIDITSLDLPRLEPGESSDEGIASSEEEIESVGFTRDSLVPEDEEIGFEALHDPVIGDGDANVKVTGSEDGSATGEDPPDPLVSTGGSPEPGDGVEIKQPEHREQDEPIGLSFDPELLTIYQQEVEQHLDIVNSALDRADTAGELIPSEEIYRALHTIHGASRTADIASIGELSGLMEKPLKTAIAQNMALDHEIVALYRTGHKALHEMTAELVVTRQMPTIPSDLKVSLTALADDFEEYTVDLTEEDGGQAGQFIDTLTMMSENVEVEQDAELLEIFVDEANELLEMSDNTLHQWSQQEDESDSQDYAAVMELQRYLHTLKGGARMAELKEISDLSHEMESLFIAVIDGRVEKTPELLEQLGNAFDLLHRQVSEAQLDGELSNSQAMVDVLKKLRRGESEETRQDIPDETPGYSMDSEDIDIVSENLPGESITNLDRAAQDVIKVRADLLDNLVSSAGEVSIYRARMEQQVAGLGSHLGELGQTIARLKSQLRALEAETDAQIHYSHRSEAQHAGEFDPLEMDRYTMIQELSRSLGESVNDLSSLQNMLGDQVKDSETLLLQQSRVSTDLQDGLIKSRMVKFSGLLSRLRRLVRQSSQELGKKAELVITGEQNEVDNKVLDRMVAPLEHIIRNALSHGIETPVERVKKGKPELGKIGIDITRDGSDVVIEVSDDGAGVDIEKVRSRAMQLGLLEKGHNASDAELVQYILEPGFSTAEHVTQLSGRGVGMDVVDIEVKQLGGTLHIETTPQGTTFVARLPFTLSINQAILVRCGEEIYAIPLLNIEGITRIDAQQMHGYYRDEAPELEYAGQSFMVCNLAKLVGSESTFRPGVDTEKQAIILSRAGDVRAALHVDEIIGNREIVVKTLGKQLSQVKSLAGASILADGSVVLILDIGGLIRHSVGSAIKVVYHTSEEKASKLRNTVMVVDDSITMRRIASKLLERHNYEVITAKDGVDALAQLADVRPDVMLLDIEMPRMDGFELATHMQNEESYSRIPIIMITSRTGEKHRDRALEIGVTNYMGKPYQEEELVENIQSALAGS